MHHPNIARIYAIFIEGASENEKDDRKVLFFLERLDTSNRYTLFTTIY